MIRLMIMATIVVLGLSAPAAGALSDCINATCRITAPDGGRGTGCVFERSQGTVYVLTAAHVANARTVKCEFWQQGHQSAPLPGETILRVLNDVVDAAVIALPESAFGGRFPAAVPIAPRDYAIEAGQPLASVGCARGAWATGWTGHVIGYDGTDLHFIPAPADGRSGSALFDASGERIVGIVRARTLDSREGIATGTQALFGQLCRAAAEREAQCAPGACGPNGCPTLRDRLLPYRQQQQLQQQQLQQPRLNPWPTLPGKPAPAAPAPSPTPAPVPPPSPPATAAPPALALPALPLVPSAAAASPDPLPAIAAAVTTAGGGIGWGTILAGGAGFIVPIGRRCSLGGLAGRAPPFRAIASRKAATATSQPQFPAAGVTAEQLEQALQGLGASILSQVQTGQGKPVIVTVDSPEKAAQVITDKYAVPVPTKTARETALEGALEVYLKKYPGSESAVNTIWNLATQIQSGILSPKGV